MNIIIDPSITYVGDGIRDEYDFPFDYLRKRFIYVQIDKEDYFDFTVNEKTVKLNIAPVEGSEVVIYRSTDTTPLASYGDGSVLTANDMNVHEIQVLHILEERFINNKTWTIQQAKIFMEDLTVGEMIDVDTVLRALKTPFYAIGNWENTETGSKITIPCNDSICLGVYKETANGDEIVMTGVTVRPDCVIIEGECPFDGYVMLAAFTSWFGGDTKTLNTKINEILQYLANEKQDVEDVKNRVNAINNKVNNLKFVKTVNGVEPDENGNIELNIDLDASYTKSEADALFLTKTSANATYMNKNEVFVKTVNGVEPDVNGNVEVQSGGDTSNCVKYDNSVTQTLECDAETKDADIQFTNQGYVNSAGFDIRTKNNNNRLRLRPSNDYKMLMLQYQNGSDASTRVRIPVEMAQKDSNGDNIIDTYAKKSNVYTKAEIDAMLVVDENIELPLESEV